MTKTSRFTPTLLIMKILLTEWAEREYNPPPSCRVLRQWAKLGEIQPPPERVGRVLMVEETAKRVPLEYDTAGMSDRAKKVLLNVA